MMNLLNFDRIMSKWHIVFYRALEEQKAFQELYDILDGNGSGICFVSLITV